MPPKGAEKCPAELGSINHDAGNGRWRAEATLFSQKTCGPWRGSEQAAHADLSYAREATSREDMRSRFQVLRSGASQPAQATGAIQNSCDAHPAVAADVGTEHGAAAVMKQPAAFSKNEKDAQPRKRLCLEAQAPTSPSIAAARSSGSTIAQSSAEGGVNKTVAIESSSSGVAQSAAAKQLPNHAGRNAGSSDVAQLAATCQEPRSTMVFMKILEPIWATEVADGQKMFECVANKTKWQNQFKQLGSGDLIVVVMKGRGKVDAVCEVASAATVKETNRDVLKRKLQQSRHEALDMYLNGAESFDYVEFKHVFDCRFLSASSTAAFLERVGLALPKTPLVGLLRPTVTDARWHSRIHEYMQQAILRLPVSLATASDKAQAAASNVEGNRTCRDVQL